MSPLCKGYEDTWNLCSAFFRRQRMENFTEEKWKIHASRKTKWKTSRGGKTTRLAKRRERKFPFMLSSSSHAMAFVHFSVFRRVLLSQNAEKNSFNETRSGSKLLPSKIRVNKINGIMMGTAIKIIIISFNFCFSTFSELSPGQKVTFPFVFSAPSSCLWLLLITSLRISACKVTDVGEIVFHVCEILLLGFSVEVKLQKLYE